jgi:rhamnopyranosyl-N-acetylglucosaminyl-diphospho-decaprenol beta-1,3/1,4-galactofuranosyltransferase
VNEDDPPRVVAVVVTYNRLALAQRLVLRLSEIPQVAEILVVDNASTDGTGAWLSRVSAGSSTVGIPSGPAGPAGPVLLHRTLEENRGGAGGFNVGLAWAIDRRADLVWLMDDDGLPPHECLTRLLVHVGRLDFWGPVVLAEQDPERLCFPIRLPGTATVLHRMSQVRPAAVDGLVSDVVIPFNGVLLTAALVDRIGLPREEFFIWGDDVEYLWRAREAGARVATVVDATFLHPATDDLGTPMLGGWTTYNHSPSDLKHYCMVRNNLLNLSEYRGPLHALAFVGKTIWFYAVTRPSRARLRLSASAMRAALARDFTGHRRFL